MQGSSNTIGVDLCPERPAVVARPVVLSPEMPLEDALHAALVECRQHIAGNIEPVVRDRDTEALHQLRVGLRRLTIAFASFGEDLHTLETLGTQAKGFFATTGQARDLDVFLTDLFEPVVAEMGPQESFSILRARAEHARARAWDAAVAQVSSVAFCSFLDRIADAVGRWPDDLLRPNATASSHAPIVLDRHLARVMKRGRGLKDRPHERYHRLRIGLKKLRYTSEFYASLYRPKVVERYVGEIKKLQDLLGALNDAAQVRTALGRLMMEEAVNAGVQADLSFAAGLINGWHHARARHITRKSHKRWRDFKQMTPFWV